MHMCVCVQGATRAMACKRVMIASSANKVQKEGPAASVASVALKDCSRARDKFAEKEGDDDDCKDRGRSRVIELRRRLLIAVDR